MKVNHYRTTPMATNDILRVIYFWSAGPTELVKCYNRRTMLDIIRFYRTTKARIFNNGRAQ